jgi:hypothetical protein
MELENARPGPRPWDSRPVSVLAHGAIRPIKKRKRAIIRTATLPLGFGDREGTAPYFYTDDARLEIISRRE